MRSPIWLRLISDVPPAIDRPRCIEHQQRRPSLPSPSMNAASGPASSAHDRRRLVADLGQHQLGDVALRPRPAAGDGAVGAAQVEHGHRLLVGDVATDPAGAARRAARGGRRAAGSSASPGTDMPPWPPPMLTLSLPERRPGDRPAAVDRPDHVVVGDEHVVEEHLVELRAARRHLQRAHLDALGLHVDDHRGDAVVLRHVGVGAHRGEPALGDVGPARPHLLPVDEPAAVDTRAARLDAGGVGAGVGLAEQLAPDDVLVERRAHPPGDLVVGGVLDEGEDHPAGDAVRRALDAGRVELLLDDELLDGAGVATPRRRPVRHRRSRVSISRRPLVGRVEAARARRRRRGPSSRIGSASGGRSTDAVAADAGSGEVGDRRPRPPRRRRSRRARRPAAGTGGRRAPR